MGLYSQLVYQTEELRKINLCHRDIKPENIIISYDGFFILTDFGLAKVLTQNGIQKISVVGTQGYWRDVIDKASRNGQKECEIDPFEADLFSIKKIVNLIMEKDHRTEKIGSELLTLLEEREKREGDKI